MYAAVWQNSDLSVLVSSGPTPSDEASRNCRALYSCTYTLGSSQLFSLASYYDTLHGPRGHARGAGLQAVLVVGSHTPAFERRGSPDTPLRLRRRRVSGAKTAANPRQGSMVPAACLARCLTLVPKKKLKNSGALLHIF